MVTPEKEGNMQGILRIIVSRNDNMFSYCLISLTIIIYNSDKSCI